METIAQMLRNEAVANAEGALGPRQRFQSQALAQTQAFEAKLSSIEAAHSAEAKRPG